MSAAFRAAITAGAGGSDDEILLPLGGKAPALATGGADVGPVEEWEGAGEAREPAMLSGKGTCSGLVKSRGLPMVVAEGPG